MNKKPTILAVAALGSLALIGTGFAGWVIAANAETSAQGTITAYEVTDNRLVLSENKWTGEADEKSAAIRFGMAEKKDSTFSSENIWFTFNESDGIEKLTATYTAKITSKNAADTGKVKASASIIVGDKDGKADENSAWGVALKDGLVAKPKCEIKCGDQTANAEGDALPGTGAGLTYTITVKFAWGDHFKKDGQGEALNPYNFYNSYGVGEKKSNATSDEDTWGGDAANALGTLSKIKDTKFTLELSFVRV